MVDKKTDRYIRSEQTITAREYIEKSMQIVDVVIGVYSRKSDFTKLPAGQRQLVIDIAKMNAATDALNKVGLYTDEEAKRFSGFSQAEITNKTNELLIGSTDSRIMTGLRNRANSIADAVSDPNKADKKTKKALEDAGLIFELPEVRKGPFKGKVYARPQPGSMDDVRRGAKPYKDDDR